MRTRIDRHRKIRSKVSGTPDRPRLAVFRSSKYIYAQIIDDTTGKTLASVTDASSKKDKVTKVDSAKTVGLEIAKIAGDKKIKKVVFDRGGSKYHGRIKTLAEGAREGGLEF